MTAFERIGPYRILQTLGAGGMGEVVLAHDDRLDRLVAIKRLRDDHAATPARRERFRREARILARLNHPAIVKLHDVLENGGHDYLIMEYVDGPTLRERRELGPLPLSEALAIAHQVALGMAAAHDLGVIHRDLKAENVLIGRDGRCKLTDFGIAKLDGDSTVTEDGVVIGTFRAMSPEQALGRAIDHRSDLFSFGILLYELLAGESPFRADSAFLTMQRLVTAEPPPISDLVPTIPRGLASLVHQLLTKEPMLRPRDFHEVADALIDLAGDACELPSRAGAAPSPAGDRRPTEDTPLPLASLASPTRGSPDTGRDRSIAAGNRPVAAGRAFRASGRRRWYAAAGVAALAAVGVVAGVVVHGGSVTGPLPRVAVLAPSIADADAHPDAGSLAAAIRDTIEDDLQERAGVQLVPRADIDRYVDRAVRDTGHRPREHAIRTAVGGDEILAIQLACSADSCKLTLARAPAPLGAPLGVTFPLLVHTAGASQPMALYLSNDAHNITEYLSELYPDHPARQRSR